MKILIIDGKNQLHRAFHAYRNLQNNGKPASIVYGLPSLITALIRQFTPDKVYVCWDGSRSKHRMKLLPTYKAGRKKFTDEERAAFNKQTEDVMRLLHYLGLKQVIHPEMEADDYIYLLARKFKKDKSNTITIISNDKDFHQLIGPRVRVYNTHKRLLLHRDNLKVNYGYEPLNCVDYLCLTGDDSDNIPGLRGVGEARAKGFIERFSSISNYLEEHEEDKAFKKEVLAPLYAINKQMIDLRYFYETFLKGNIKITYYRNNKNPKLNQEKLFKICKSYSIKMFKEPNFLKTYK